MTVSGKSPSSAMYILVLGINVAGRSTGEGSRGRDLLDLVYHGGSIVSLHSDGIPPHATMFISPIGASSAETGRHKHVLLCH